MPMPRINWGGISAGFNTMKAGLGGFSSSYGRGLMSGRGWSSPYARAGIGAVAGMGIHAGMTGMSDRADWSVGGALRAGIGGAMVGLGTNLGGLRAMGSMAGRAQRGFAFRTAAQAAAVSRRIGTAGVSFGTGVVGLGLMGLSRSGAISIATERRRKERQRQMMGNPRMMY